MRLGIAERRERLRRAGAREFVEATGVSGVGEEEIRSWSTGWMRSPGF